MSLWWCGLARSLDKLKPLYLQYQSVYSHQTWQDCNLTWLTPAYKVTSSLMTCIVKSRGKLELLYLHFHCVYGNQTWQDVSWAFTHMTLWSRGLTGSREKLNSLYFHYHSAYSHHARQDGKLPWCAPAHKVTRLFDHMDLWHHMTS